MKYRIYVETENRLYRPHILGGFPVWKEDFESPEEAKRAIRELEDPFGDNFRKRYIIIPCEEFSLASED